MFKALSPNILVADVEKSIAFYEMLGFVKIAQVPEQGKPQWAMVQADQVTIMIQEKASVDAESGIPYPWIQAASSGVFLYIDVEDLEALRTTIDGKTPILKDIHSTFYGTHEMVVADPDQYILIFAEDQK